MDSLYIPKPHLIEDRQLLHDFMEEFSFVSLVTAAPFIRVTHIPVLIARSEGQFGTIYGHIARQNPQAEALHRGQPAVIVFQGPHSYISPAWYARREVVPTWNFAVVHASGRLKAILDRQDLQDLVVRLTKKFELAGSPYDFAALPDEYQTAMLGNIVGFALEIESLEGKFKLGQEKSAADRQGILTGLASSKPERGLREFTAEFFEKPSL